MIEAVHENLTLLQTIKPVHETDIVYRVDTAVHISAFYFSTFSYEYQRTDRRRKRLLFLRSNYNCYLSIFIYC